MKLFTPRNPASNCIQICNLIMPFSIIELRDLMGEYGIFERCWTNRVMSHCMVEFLSMESADKAIHDLMLRQWPVAGKRLILDYIQKPKMDQIISNRLISHDLDDIQIQLNTDENQKTSTSKEKELRFKMQRLKKEKHLDQLSELNNLFKKTTAKPVIYYLPHNNEYVRKLKEASNS